MQTTHHREEDKAKFKERRRNGEPSSSGRGSSGRERIGDYVIGNEIGRGSFATVYKGYRSRSKQPIAIKAVSRNKLTPKLLENLEGEISILKAISHRHIVELEDCIKNDHHIYLIMAFCSGGDLSIYIKKRGRLPTLDYPRLLPDGTRDLNVKQFWPHLEEGGLDAAVTRCFLGQLTEAIKFLRVRDLIHRDIKPQNLLLHPPTEEEYSAGHPYGIPVLKVADFGFARILPAATMAETLCGSPLYMAPEILRYEKYDAKVDLWSIGAVLFEMAVGRPPFRAQNHVELLRRIEKGEDRIKFPDEKLPSELKPDEAPSLPVDEDIKTLIRKLLKKNPENRMPFQDLFDSKVWDGYLTRSPLKAVEDREAPPLPTSVPLTREDSRSRRRSRDVVSQDGRRPSEPRYFVSSDVPSPKADESSARPQERPPSRSRQSSTPSSSRPIDIPPLAPQPAHARPVMISSPLAEQVVPMIRRPSTSSARRYSTLGRGVSRIGERSTPDSASPASEAAGLAQPVERAVSRTSVDRSSDSIRPASATGNMQESEYVVVEKKTVEVNALADELDAAAKRPDGLVRRRSSRGGVLGRPISALTSVASQAGQAGSSPTSYSPPFTLSTTPPFALPPGSHHRAPSLQSISSSPNVPTRTRPMLVPSPTTNAMTPYGGGMTYHQTAHEAVFAESPPPGSSAWARAMGIAGMKLLGSPVNALGHLSRRPWRQARLSLTYKEEDPAEEILMSKLEDLAQKAHALFEFADAKLGQCMFAPKLSPSGGLSGGAGLGLSPNSHSYFNQQSAASRRRSSSASTSSTDINIARMEALCAEAMVLYLKALAFLQNGVEQAKQYWEKQAAHNEVVKTSAEFNETVQWFRHRFNDCFDKAEWTKSRSPEEMPESASYVEKLIYDKAIELSRAAAVTELVGEDLLSSESGYETALWLLYSVLDPLLHDGLEIGDSDRHMVEKVIGSIRTRLDSLRRKISQGNQQLNTVQ